MTHYHTIPGQIIKLIPIFEFDKAVKTHNTEDLCSPH